MIGNDIVDLQLASYQSNWQRKGWLQKIFTTKEQRHIHTSENPNLMVWKLWSMKEATYKVHQNYLSHAPRYSPLDFDCSLHGKVYIHNHTYCVKTETTKEYVHSVAMQYDDNYDSKIMQNDKDLKLRLKQTLAQKIDVNISNIMVKKDKNRIPRIYIDRKETNIGVSLTHHGEYSAFVIEY